MYAGLWGLVGMGTEKQAVGRMAAFVSMRVTEGGQELSELLLFAPRNLDSDQDAAIIGPVVAVMEQ